MITVKMISGERTSSPMYRLTRGDEESASLDGSITPPGPVARGTVKPWNKIVMCMGVLLLATTLVAAVMAGSGSRANAGGPSLLVRIRN